MSQIPDPKPIGQSMSAAFISQILQKIQPTLDSVYNRRFSQATNYVNGASTPAASIAAASSTITSTGATGTYAINFAPVTFKTIPIVIAWCSKESGGNPVLVNLDAVTKTLFQFDLNIPGVGAITVGHTVSVDYIAVGS